MLILVCQCMLICARGGLMLWPFACMAKDRKGPKEMGLFFERDVAFYGVYLSLQRLSAKATALMALYIYIYVNICVCKKEYIHISLLRIYIYIYTYMYIYICIHNKYV